MVIKEQTAMDIETRLNEIWDRQIEISHITNPTEELLHELAQLSIEENMLERALRNTYKTY